MCVSGLQVVDVIIQYVYFYKNTQYKKATNTKAYHFTPSRIAVIEKTDVTSAGGDVKKLEPSHC